MDHIAETIKNAAHAEDVQGYCLAIGMGADQLVPAIREMQGAGMTPAQVSQVLKHAAGLVAPAKRKK